MSCTKREKKKTVSEWLYAWVMLVASPWVALSGRLGVFSEPWFANCSLQGARLGDLDLGAEPSICHRLSRG